MKKKSPEAEAAAQEAIARLEELGPQLALDILEGRRGLVVTPVEGGGFTVRVEQPA